MPQTKIAYPAQTSTSDGILYDLMRDQSMVNSKNHEYTTRDGHLKGVLCDITITAQADGYAFIYGANNTWKLRNSVRKFHFLREHMFRESGVKKSEMGTYGKTMRPYFDADHAGGDTPDQPIFIMKDGGSGLTPTDFVGGEWKYTKLASVPSYEEQAGPETVLPEVDEWKIHLFDESVVDKTSSGSATGTTAAVTWSSVGMIHAYNLDRQSVQTQTTKTSIDGPNNPLAALAGAGNQATGAIVELAEELEEELPPYDLNDNGDSVHFAQLGFRQFPNTGGSYTFRNVFLPAGYMRVIMTDKNVAQSTYSIDVDVLAEIDCRDLA
jgi:hypothetical protein